MLGNLQPPSDPARRCPYDEHGVAMCPFNEPTSLATWHRSRVHCRHLHPQPTPDGFMAMCARDVDEITLGGAAQPL